MPRKRTKTTTEHEAPGTAIAEQPNDVQQAFDAAGITAGDQLPQPEHNGHAEGNGQDSKATFQPRPVRPTFTSSAAGVRAVEDKRFALPRVGIDFDDDKRATDEEKAELKERGLRYDVRDKGYTSIANAETRQARDELAQKFTDRRLKQKTEPAEGQTR